MMAEFRSASLAEFTAWHEKFKTDHAYPLQGHNALTGKLVDVGRTTEYTEPIIVDSTDVRFSVDAKDVPVLPGKLAVAPTFKLDGTVDVVKSKADQAALDTKPK